MTMCPNWNDVKKKMKAGLYGLFLVVLPLQVQAQPEKQNANDLFRQMLNARNLFAYEGILTYERAGRLHSYRVNSDVVTSESIGASAENTVQSLNALSGAARDYLYVSDQNFGLHDRCTPRRQSILDGLEYAYNFFYGGEGRVGGRIGHEIVLMPMDEYHLGYRYVVDKETGLMLQSVAMLPDRTVLERAQFVDLKINTASAVEARNTTISDDSVDCASKKESLMGWSLGWVPDGFSLRKQTEDNMRTSLHFGDGISTFSVFIEPSGLTPMPAGNLQNGATALAIRHYRGARSSYMMTLVGEVPPISADLVLQNLEPSGDR